MEMFNKSLGISIALESAKVLKHKWQLEKRKQGQDLTYVLEGCGSELPEWQVCTRRSVLALTIAPENEITMRIILV